MSIRKYKSMKVCIITGGSQGLGLDMAKSFSNKGFKVVVLDILECPLVEVDFIKTDLSETIEVKNAFKLIYLLQDLIKIWLIGSFME